ncbi:PspA/IM30 family protein [Gulosibacter sediminis]|uniref:PspA/IM30 family protein n=1 Tax=Gulosibacter sediminis TaxID=1729695 RepID=UPI0024AD6911|nr:PspA/IM30 family protein [Gulosibacter sediminis]
MAQKQSIFGRISQLVRANINSLIDQAEDPQIMIDQLIRDYSANIADAEAAISQTIGNLRMLEDDARQDEQDARDWGQKALAASNKADEFRNSGDTASADKFDNLAKVAIQRQVEEEGNVNTARPQIEQQTQVVDQLKNGLEGMRGKLNELIRKRDELSARAKTAEAQGKVNDALSKVNVLDPTTDLGRFEEKVRREEARVRGQQELQASSLDKQFEELENVGQMTEVEARLAALKSGNSQSSITQ